MEKHAQNHDEYENEEHVETVQEEETIHDNRLQFFKDIPISLSVELGRSKITVRDFLEYNDGSVIELDKLAGDPMNIYMNGKLIARGEVVVMNDKFAVRLTDIVKSSFDGDDD